MTEPSEFRKALLRAWEAGWDAHEAFVACAPPTAEPTNPDPQPTTEDA